MKTSFIRVAAAGLTMLLSTSALASLASAAPAKHGVAVKGYTRHLKNGKTVAVKGYTRKATPKKTVAVHSYMRKGKMVHGYTRPAGAKKK